MSEGTDPHIAEASRREVESDAPLWALYDTAFPAEEREPRSVTHAGLERGLVDVLRLRSTGETLGFAIVHRLVEPEAAFLVYLAVAPNARGKGLGAALFEEVARRSRGGVVWEVDRPAMASDAAERALRERRQRFFERLGGRIVFSDYLQPALHGPSPVPMALMAFGAALSAPVEALVHALYFEKYAALNGASGVLASVGSLALCMEFGFKNVAFFGVAAYVVAWLLLYLNSRSSGAGAPSTA